MYSVHTKYITLYKCCIDILLICRACSMWERHKIPQLSSGNVVQGSATRTFPSIKLSRYALAMTMGIHVNTIQNLAIKGSDSWKAYPSQLIMIRNTPNPTNPGSTSNKQVSKITRHLFRWLMTVMSNVKRGQPKYCDCDVSLTAPASM